MNEPLVNKEHPFFKALSAVSTDAAVAVSKALTDKTLTNTDKLLLIILVFEDLTGDSDTVEMSYADIKERLSGLSKTSFRRSLRTLKSSNYIFTKPGIGVKSRLSIRPIEETDKSNTPVDRLYPPADTVRDTTSATGGTSTTGGTSHDNHCIRRRIQFQTSVAEGTTQDVVVRPDGVTQDVDLLKNNGIPWKKTAPPDFNISTSSVAKKEAKNDNYNQLLKSGACAPQLLNNHLLSTKQFLPEGLLDTNAIICENIDYYSEGGDMSGKPDSIGSRGNSSNYNNRKGQKSSGISFSMSPATAARLVASLEAEKEAEDLEKLAKPVIAAPNQKGLFSDPGLNKRKNIAAINKSKVRPPRNILEYYQSFRDEMSTRWPDTELPPTMSRKDMAQLKQNVAIYQPHQVLSMIRILVWDWETLRTACFPYMPNRPRPTIENLWRHANDLFSAIGIGITDSREGRSSKYKQRYVDSASQESSSPEKKSLSMLERFRARRGN